MSWYYTSWDGQIFEMTGAQKFIQDRQINVGNATGWALTGGKAEYGPFATQADAQKAKDQHPATGPLAAAHSAAHEVNQGVTQGWKFVFGNFTGILTRGLKIVFGGLLIVMGVLQFSGRTQREAIGVIGSKVGIL